MVRPVDCVALAARPFAAASAAEVRLGHVPISFYALAGKVVRAVPERNGHDVETIEGSHAEIHRRLGAGEVDLRAVSRLSNGHAGLFAQMEDSVERPTQIYDNARFSRVVPTYSPENQVSKIPVRFAAERVPDIVSTRPSSTDLTRGAERMMEAYDLNAAADGMVPGAGWTPTPKRASDGGPATDQPRTPAGRDERRRPCHHSKGELK